MYRAASELKSGHPEKAIELLAPLARYESLTHPEVIYLRGLCYLAAHQGAQAAAEFQKMIDHKGGTWGPLLPASYAGLARAYALAGDAPHARTAYQDFLAFWKDADADIPLLVQARKEYAALQ
jgi:tetratricopeptide (TPR) repeat protein